MENDDRILKYCFNSYVKLNIDTHKLNPLHYISLPGYRFDCFLKLSKVELDTLQDEQRLKDFISVIGGGICRVMADRYVSNGETWTKSHSNRNIWYIDANNLYGYALMQKFPYKDFQFITTIYTPDDSEYGYWLICDFDYTSECKDRTSNFPLQFLRREVEDN